MSNSLAIAAVTATLRRLLQKSGIEHVTVKPLDKAPEGIDADKQRINLFLYQVLPDAALRNMEMPGRVKPGENGHPPLPLTLYYLLTAYSGNEDDETKSHALLGKAMSILHDHPLLGSEEIKDAVKTPFPESDLADQIERIRIINDSRSFEEMSKLWTTFQTHYRLSATYQASVVLIESTRPTRMPLPVLTRGKDDRGVVAQPDLTPPFPTLTEITIPKQQPSVLLNDELSIKGHHLDGDSVVVRLMSQQLKDPIELQLQKPTANELKAKVPNDPVGVPAGFYTLSAIITRTDTTGEKIPRFTNALALSLAPEIVRITPNPARLDAQKMVVLNVECRPEVRVAQRAALLLGDREIPAEARAGQTNSLKFRLKNILPGTYFLRLRVDGVDSPLVDRSKTPPVFDENQKVIIQ